MEQTEEPLNSAPPHPPENYANVVWTLAWPAVLLNSLQVLNTLLDRGFIGHLPLTSLTAHGAATNAMFLSFSLAVAMATGATAIVSRAYGAKREDEVRSASTQSIRLGFFFGIMLGVLLWLGSPAISLAILPAQDLEAKRLMTSFLRLVAIGMPAITLIQVIVGCLRGIGDTKSPMVISGFQIGLQMLLNVVLIDANRVWMGIPIPGANLGLDGAGAAISLSAWVSAVGYLCYLARTPLGSQWRLVLPDVDWATRILRIAVPAGTMAVLRVLSLTAFTLVLTQTDSASVAIAAMSIAFAIESIMFMPSFGLSTAAGALVGQSLGMQRPDRAERIAWVAAHHAGWVTVALAIPISIFAPDLVSVLVGDKPDLVEESVRFIRLLCLTEVMFAYAMVMVGALQGAGDTVRPLWIAVLCMWGMRVPLAYVLAVPLQLGPFGAWLSMSITQAIQRAMSILAWKQGAWKTKEV
jgi:putative MATE family efflux protein